MKEFSIIRVASMPDGGCTVQRYYPASDGSGLKNPSWMLCVIVLGYFKSPTHLDSWREAMKYARQVELCEQSKCGKEVLFMADATITPKERQ